MSNLTTLSSVRGVIRYDFDLSKSNWFATGGKAEILFKPYDQEDLVFFFKNKPICDVNIIGIGSNLIIKDEGVKGVIIKLGGNFAKINRISSDLIEVGAGALCYNTALFCKINSLSGLEFLTGIPGSIGGAIAMNAGCYGSEISDCLISATAIDRNGIVSEIMNKEFYFSYRDNALNDLFFTKAKFRVHSSSFDIVSKKMDLLSKNRKEHQPIKNKTGGSTFKNHSKYKAWKLIDKSGCRGMRVGGAKISEKHCNFIINYDNATSSDIINLTKKVQRIVKNKTGILLEMEIKIF